jgi:4-amino-4-deoxy-L-arabinose transferase-like glycosyltransferase
MRSEQMDIVLGQALFAISHYAFIGILGAVSYVLGKRLLNNITFKSDWEDVSFSTVVGLGIVGYLVFLLGSLHVLTVRSILGVLVYLVLLSILSWPDFSIARDARQAAFIRARNAIRTTVTSPSLLMVGLLGIFVLLTFTLPLYPPTAWDATEYHLAMAKIYVRSEGLVLTKYLRFPVNTQLGQMLFTLALLFSDDISAQLVQYLAVILVAVAAYAFSLRHLTPRAGILAAALWLSSPMIVWSASGALIDAILTMFMATAVFAFFNYYQTRQTGWLVLTCVLTGFAAATKYPALLLVPVFGLSLCLTALRDRNWRLPLVFGILVLVVGSPFYLRNTYYSGNPIFPLLTGIFPARLWTQTDVISQAAELGTYGLSRTWSSFIELPWYLVINDDIFFSELGGTGDFSPILFCLLPLAFYFVAEDHFIRKLMAIFLILMVFWFMSAQVLRYMIPAVLLLSLIIAGSMDRALAAFETGGRLGRLQAGRRKTLSPVIVAGCALLIMIPAVHYAAVSIRQRGWVPITTAQRDAYLTVYRPSYPAYQFLNKRAGTNYVLYALLDEDMVYFANGQFMGDWFGPARFADVLSRLDSGQALYQHLRGLGADYFLVNSNRLDELVPRDEVFTAKFKKVFSRNGVTVYELAPEP